MKKNKEKLIITPENYKGYCALHEIRYETDDWIKRFLFNLVKNFLVGVLCTVISLFILPGVITILIGVFTLISIPIAVEQTTKKQKQNVKNKYSNININISEEALEEALRDSNILKTKIEDGFVIKYLDVEGYENMLKLQKIKEKMLKENLYNPLVFDANIPEKEMEKVKTKIKTMKK